MIILDYGPLPSYVFRRRMERIKAAKIGTTIKQTTNSRKVPYTTAYELQRSMNETRIIDEINRQNMTSDYGV